MNRKVKFMFILFVSLFISSSLLCGISSAEPPEMAVGRNYFEPGEAVVPDGDDTDEGTSGNSGNSNVPELPDENSNGRNYSSMPNPTGFINHNTLEDKIDDAMVNSGLSSLYALLLKVGLAIALIVLTVYGVNWIIASPAKKAELKQSVAPIIVAVFILTAGLVPAITISQTILGFFEGAGGAEEAVISVTQSAFSIIRTLGFALAILIIVIIGIEWLIATPQKRAELKGKIYNVIIGLAILIGAVTILTVLQELFS